MTVSRATTRNLLLRSLSDEDHARVQPHLVRTGFERRRKLVETNKPFDQVYFPEDGVASVVMRLADGGEMEVPTMRSYI